MFFNGFPEWFTVNKININIVNDVSKNLVFVFKYFI